MCKTRKRINKNILREIFPFFFRGMLYLPRRVLKFLALSSEASHPQPGSGDPGHDRAWAWCEMCLQASKHPQISHLLLCLRTAASQRSLRGWPGKDEDSQDCGADQGHVLNQSGDTRHSANRQPSARCLPFQKSAGTKPAQLCAATKQGQ